MRQDTDIAASGTRTSPPDRPPTAQRASGTDHHVELRKIIESHGEVRLILAGGAPENKKELYNAIELQVRYAYLGHRMIITTSPVGDSAGVRRGHTRYPQHSDSTLAADRGTRQFQPQTELNMQSHCSTGGSEHACGHRLAGVFELIEPAQGSVGGIGTGRPVMGGRFPKASG